MSRRERPSSSLRDRVNKAFKSASDKTGILATHRRYRTHEIDENGWTPWVYPKQDGYRWSCCDCGLVHEMQFRVTSLSEVEFRARRNERSTAAKRRAYIKPSGET